MAQQPEPVGWWCEGGHVECEVFFEVIPGALIDHPRWCKGKLLAVYSSTQVRKGFEGVAVELEETGIGTLKNVAKELRRRMEEW